jgi:predicted transposase YbfD/YdcC
VNRFVEIFELLPDPRASNSRHDLSEVLFIAFLATLCGATSCVDMEDFGSAKEELLCSFLTLKHGIPSHDTFSAVFRMIDPKAFEALFRQFMAEFGAAAKLGAPKGVVAVDGKALRRAYAAGHSHMPKAMVSLWAAQTRMTLASTLAEGSDEAGAALELIKLVALKGCILTADALHCHREMAKAVVTQHGDYVLALKSNQPGLLADAKALIEEAQLKQAAGAQTDDARHGRQETRHASVASAKHMAVKHDFPRLKAVARITSRRGTEKPLERYFLMSQPYTPEQVLSIVRSHWGIENALHWTLDVVLDEDLARNRKDYAPQNLAILRRLALNIARAHPDTKTSMRLKLKRAGWNENFLFELLAHMR